MRLNELVSMRATVAGMTSVAAISVTPSTCIVARIDAASTSMSSASTRAVLTPDDVGDLGVEGREQQRAGSARNDQRRRPARSRRRSHQHVAAGDAEDAAEQRGVEAAAAPCRTAANSARPSANDAVVMTPIAASAPITPPAGDAVDHAAPRRRPTTPAPRKKLTPSSALAAKPPKIACDRPWPM